MHRQPPADCERAKSASAAWTRCWPPVTVPTLINALLGTLMEIDGTRISLSARWDRASRAASDGVRESNGGTRPLRNPAQG
jgi:hypothetical protein